MRYALGIITAVFIFSGLTCALVWAQAGTAQITGTVKDQSGAVLPGVVITITNIDTNSERTFTTDDHGEYNIPFLPAGTYRIEAALLGFKTDVAENIFLDVDDRLQPVMEYLERQATGEEPATSVPPVPPTGGRRGVVVHLRRPTTESPA